ncbi:hypothetical protein [Spirosoma sordidisoli]|uniref:hypothetical protein n=1 Tax=Spirosoma sordidisoli TaxID=2502893 RepID=UPI001F0E98A1|nr:hypothetical protein [Spirosoma sordidisoli]
MNHLQNRDDKDRPNTLLEAAGRYREILAKMTERVSEEDAPTMAMYLGLSMTNYYIKRRGERPFNYADIARLVERYGSDEEQADLQAFFTIRDGLYEWLQKSPIPLVQFRRLLGLQHYRDLAHRGTQPNTWRLDDLEKIGAFLAQIGQV